MIPSPIIQIIKIIRVPFIKVKRLVVDWLKRKTNANNAIIIMKIIGIKIGIIFLFLFQKYIDNIIKVKAANIWLLAPKVVHNSFRRASLVAIKYAGITDINVDINLFLNNYGIR